MQSKDFKRAFKKGRAIRSPHFVLYLCGNGLDHSRLGFSFSRSRIKLATRRNRLKRIIREIWRREFAPGLKGLDLVLVAKSKPASDDGILKKEIRDAFNRPGKNS